MKTLDNYKIMTNEQAIRACILAQFLTNTLKLKIVLFLYYEDRETIYIQTLPAKNARSIKLIINNNGKFKYL